MNPPSGPTLERWLIETLRRAQGPLTTEQILERVPSELATGERDPRKKLKLLLTRPEVGRAARGSYVYLPSRITGSTLRLPITGSEVDEGWLWVGPELIQALWFRQVEDWGRVPVGSDAACELPDGSRGRIVVEQLAHHRGAFLGSVPLIKAGPELRDWLRTEGAASGDSLRVRIVDAEQVLFRLDLERLPERNRERVAQRNEQLANAADEVLRLGVRGKPLSGNDLAAWLLAAGLFHDECPPDPLIVVLARDPRFTQDRHGHFARATKWEWVRERNEELPEEFLQALSALHLERQPALEAGPSLSRAELWARLGVDPLAELRPWLEAVGYESGEAGDEEADAEEDSASGADVVYQFRATFQHRPSTQRVIEARGDNSMVELDDALRRAFRHDTMDHMSGFFVHTASGRRREALAPINPFGGVEEGEDLELAELGLERGDELLYVYDFGDWIEHTVQVEAILAPKPGVTYPRQVGRGAGTAAGRRKGAERAG